MNTAYPRYPSLHDNALAFSADDDLWSVDATGGVARRLTNTSGVVTYSHYSPDGQQIAFVSNDDGADDLYLMDASGGVPQRLTYHGAPIHWVGWSPSATGPRIRYCSEAEAAVPFPRTFRLWEVIPGESPRLMPEQTGASFSESPEGARVLLRAFALSEPVKWKRYRGGTRGQIWVDQSGDGNFQHLEQLAGNIDNPHILGDRIFYLSDYQGIGNVYSCRLDGSDVRRHTDHDTYYARNLASDGRRLSYHCGGELYVFDPETDVTGRVDMSVPASETRKARRFVTPGTYLRSAALSPEGVQVTINARGKLFAMNNWHGPTVQLGAVDGVGYREPVYTHDGASVVAVASSFDKDDYLVRIPVTTSEPEVAYELGDIGRIIEMSTSGVDGQVVMSNHRRELIWVDTDSPNPHQRVLHTADHSPPSSLSFSPDGKWVVFTTGQVSADGEEGRSDQQIFLCELETGHITLVTRAVLSDEKPAFDPLGRFLYFVGRREFEPLADAMQIDMGFAWGTRPYAVVLQHGAPPPFLGDAVVSGSDDGTTRIDREGLADRVVPLPVDAGTYEQILPTKDSVVLVAKKLRPASTQDLFGGSSQTDHVVTSVDLQTGTVTPLAESVTSAQLSADGKRLLYRSAERLRVIDLSKEPESSDKPSPETGWIDLDRIKLSINPRAEWPQMLAEAWRLQRDHFWMESMGGVDWKAMFERYVPMLDRIATRSEFADVLAEMQGELGTSHCYSRYGDFALPTPIRQGYLAASFALVEGTYRITEIANGDRWRPEATSPLHRPGVEAQVGDEILAVNGMPVGTEASIEERLVNLAEQEVQLTLRSANGQPRTVSVRTLASTMPARYRDWVNHNREQVHVGTNGRVGYIHIPDMAAEGYAEFYRAYLNEFDREALVVDLRHNGGGFLSSQILNRLMVPRVGHRSGRNKLPVSKPFAARRGPMVGITDEWAGSDGDMGSHAFKSQGLGPLIGTQTWGGLVGIYARFRLADDTLVTQPESASHPDDVGFGIENHGATPDIEVKYRPQDYVDGRDPQLEAAIDNILQQLETAQVSRFQPWSFPDLRHQELPPRPQGQ